jgi:hypothetical protein
MADPFGGFTEEALAAYQKALAEQEGTDFAEGDSYDFTTCIRPDGSAYGTGGKCRKGTEGEAKGRDAKVEKARAKVQEAKASGDKKKLASANHNLQGEEIMRKIERKAEKEGKTFQQVADERNAVADKKIKDRIRAQYPGMFQAK